MYYKRLNIRLEHVSEIGDQLQSLLSPEILGVQGFYDLDLEKIKDLPLLWTELAKLGLKPPDLWRVYGVILPAGDTVPIHTDGGKASLALNWPCSGHQGTKTMFYELKPGTGVHGVESKITPTGKKFQQYGDSDVMEVDAIEYYDQPVIINVHKIHAVHNPLPITRITASLRFSKDLFAI